MKKQYTKLSLLLVALFALGSAKGETWLEYAQRQDEYKAMVAEETIRQMVQKQAAENTLSDSDRALNDMAVGLKIANVLDPILSPVFRAVIQHYTLKYLTKPTLLVDSSPRKDFLGKLTQFFSKAKAPEQIDMALATEDSQDPIIEKVKINKQLAQNGVPGVVQQNYLFHGPPGTGKTLRAQKMARESNMDFAIMTGASLFKFSCAEALTEIDNLFKYANKNPNGTVIVIDEAEALLLDRNTLPKNSMEYKIVDHLLTYIGTKTPNIVLVMTTNHPEFLDQAVKDRIDNFVEMGLPDQALREKVIELFVNKTFLSEQNNNLVLMAQAREFWTPTAIADMAAQTEGYSNRTLQGVVSGLYVATIQNNGITQELIESALEQANKKMRLMNTQAAGIQTA